MSKRCLGCMELYSDEFEMCPHCGYIEGTEADESIHINPGTLLHDRYIIGKVLGYGGFGVTYIAWDGKLEQKVAIKEYLPSEFSTRMPGQTSVTIFNGDKNEQFHDGLTKFIEEAKRLAKFQNEPGIVKVFDCFSENETAYIVMEYLDGETLTERLKQEKTIPEDEAVRMLEPLMNSLQVVHQEGILHRDIAPDNIFLTKSGEVKLIDFGASRYATTSHSRSLTVIIKPGYSPEEQYRSRGDQGAYTDVYALAATMYRMITGKTPPDAMERRAKYESQSKDILVAPHKLNKNISINRENAILNAMNVRIEDRTPDVATFAKELNEDPPAKRRYGKIKKLDLYSWPLWLKIAIPVVLVALLTFGILLLTGVIHFSSPYSDEVVVPEGMVVVPNLEGMDRDEAWQLVVDSQLNPKLGDPVESDYVTPGKVVLQTPNSGTYLEKYGSVTLSVGIGKVREGIIPYCDTCTEEVARERIADAGYGKPIIEYVYTDKADEKDRVVRQDPEPGTEADFSTVITLYVSKGLAPFKMPSLEGTIEEVKAELLSRGWDLEAVEFVDENSSDPKGTVIRQDPPEGTEVTTDTPITIYVSSGAGEDSSSEGTDSSGEGASSSNDNSETVSSGNQFVSVRNVEGKSRSNAISTLQSQGFEVRVEEKYDPNIAEDNVISQSPAPGKSLEYGSTVTIYVSKGKQPVTVTFHANGGSVDESKKTEFVSSLYSLPNATRPGYSFDGWYTSATGGSLVDKNTKVTNANAHDLYAHWTIITYKVSWNPGTGYSINVSRTSSPNAKASTGTLSNGAAIYYGDVLAVTYTKQDYYTISKNGATSITVTGNVTSSNIYATAELNPVVGWVPESQVPRDAYIVDQKWTYTKTMETKNSSESGWDQVDSYWKEVVSGTHEYASFTTTKNGKEYYSTSDQYYQKYNGTAYASYDNGTTKRVVSGSSIKSYIYYHWCFPMSGTFSEGNRQVGEYYGERVNGGATTIWESYEGGYVAKNVDAYEIHGHSKYSYWWVGGIPVYTQTYTDYEKWYVYQKVFESSTEVSNGGDISNVQKYVKYRNK